MVNVEIVPIDRDLDVWLKWRLRCHVAFAYIGLCFELWCRTMHSCVWERQYTLCRLFIFKCHWIFYVNSWETILSSSAVPLVLFSRYGNVEPTKSYLWIGSFVSYLTTMYKRLKLFNVELYERMILSCEMARKGGGRILWFVDTALINVQNWGKSRQTLVGIIGPSFEIQTGLFQVQVGCVSSLSVRIRFYWLLHCPTTPFD